MPLAPEIVALGGDLLAAVELIEIGSYHKMSVRPIAAGVVAAEAERGSVVKPD